MGVQGPPGTGKTRTILALVGAMASVFTAAERPRQGGEPADFPSLLPWNFHCSQLGQILVCADTNAATDNMVEGLLALGIDVVRIGQPAKVSLQRMSCQMFHLSCD